MTMFKTDIGKTKNAHYLKGLIFCTVIISLLLLSNNELFAQNGTVKSSQKISSTAGSFGVTLDSGVRFGISVASLGDLNSDGVKDIVVGSFFDNDGASTAGAVYVIFLNSDGTVKAKQKISSTAGGFTGTLATNDLFGRSVANIGDLNKDGVIDIAVGETCDDDGASNAGALWILFLNSDGTVKSHQKISNTSGGFTGTISADDQFGSSVKAIGDLDSNGAIDLAVGARFGDDGASDAGELWVLFMKKDGTVLTYEKISNTSGLFTGTLNSGAGFGSAVAAVGDMNGDSVSDMVVSSEFDNDGANFAGSIWVLFMNSDGTVKSHQKISSTSGNFTGTLDVGDTFGTDLASIGDLDNDGIKDLVVGAVGDDDGASGAGAVWILFMNSNGTVKSHQKISASSGNFTGTLDANDFFGHGVASIGDINGDGVSDIGVGVLEDDDGNSDAGALWILFMNGAGGAVTPTVSFSPTTSTGLESTGTITPTIALSSASDLTITVDYGVTGGTAAGSGTDFLLNSGTLTYSPGQSSQTIPFSINDDSIIESDETIIVSISNPSNATLGANTTFTYTIIDDDGLPIVSFDSSTLSVNESAGTATILVSFHKVGTLSATVDYTISGGTAVQGSDYTLSNGTLSYNIGDTTKSISVGINDDILVESDETITLSLSNASNAKIGLTSSIVLVIQNNDSTPDELCGNGADDDGDGLIDCNDSDCRFFCTENCSDGVDNDQDGDIDCDDRDCQSQRVCDIPPVVDFLTPVYGETLNGFVTFQTEVRDIHGVSLVEFLVDDEVVDTYRFDSRFYSINIDTRDLQDGVHSFKFIAEDKIGQKDEEGINAVVNNGVDLPLNVMSPVFGKFHIDSEDKSLPINDWSFWQHKNEELGHAKEGGVGSAGDLLAWDMNLIDFVNGAINSDADVDIPVFSVANGVVAATYGGCVNGGGDFGQVLIDHGGWFSGYLHLGEIVVNPGDNVSENTQLGLISNTGTSDNHLHFVVYAGENLDGCDKSLETGGLVSFNVGFQKRKLWPMFRQNANRTGGVPILGAGLNNKLKKLFNADSIVDSSIILGPDDEIFFGSFDGVFYQLSSEGAFNNWFFLDNNEIVSSPAFGDDRTIYLGTIGGFLFALDRFGFQRWRFTTNSPIPSSPLVTAGGLICFGCWDKKVYALNSDGGKEWEFETNGEIFASPTLSKDGNQIYIGSYDGIFYSIDLEGKEVWKFETGNLIRSSAVVDDEGMVFVSSWDKNLYAINVDGTLKWKSLLQNVSDTSPAIYKNSLLLGDNGGKFYAFDRNSGTELWRFQTNGANKSSPLVDRDGNIFFGSEDKHLYALDKDGKLINKFETDGIIHASPAINSNGNILFGTSDGFVYSTDTGSDAELLSKSNNKSISLQLKQRLMDKKHFRKGRGNAGKKDGPGF